MSVDASYDPLPHLVAELAASVQAFHQRFCLMGPYSQEQLLSRIPIQGEEVRELEQAIRYETPERVASEAADVLYVAIGTLVCLDPELVAVALAEVVQKNNVKTQETHHLNAEGKVVRRSQNA